MPNLAAQLIKLRPASRDDLITGLNDRTNGQFTSFSRLIC